MRLTADSNWGQVGDEVVLRIGRGTRNGGKPTQGWRRGKARMALSRRGSESGARQLCVGAAKDGHHRATEPEGNFDVACGANQPYA